ncbi:hypothetical protein SMICM304S_03072 [Streptomyces microflavus]
MPGLPGDDGGRSDLRVRREPGLDLPELIWKPRIFTWSSLRPRNSSVWSSRRRTRSPVRYIRPPGTPWSAPKGSATNRSAVRSGQPAEVADGQAGTGDVQLTGHPGGHGTQGGVQDIGPRSTHGSAPGPVGGIAGQPGFGPSTVVSVGP